MGKTAQKKKRSFWKTALGEFAEKFGKGSQNPDEDMSPILEVGEPGTWSVIGARSAHNKQNRQGNKGLEEDHSAPVHEDHVEPEKREKAIGHIETLLEQISRLQDDIDNSLQAGKCLEQEIIDLAAAIEQTSKRTGQRKPVEGDREQKVDELPVTEKPVPKKRSKKHTQKKDSRHVNREAKKKLCLKCRKQKTRNDFHKDQSCKDGLARWCKECKTKAARKYRRKRTAMKN